MIEVYKKGQGAAGRWAAMAALGGLLLFGCAELSESLNSRYDKCDFNLWVVSLSLGQFVSALVFIAGGSALLWLSNTPKWADFLIMSETELRKVSWPSRPDVLRQTLVVIVTLCLFGVILLVIDMSFAHLSAMIYGLK